MPQTAHNWIDAFRQRHGRAPRILHLGNVANNAYQNAKILNAAGADCDVLSADYYHAMGTPEWEDAAFEGKPANMDYPAWHRLKLHGFVRPRWFCAGPRRLAIAYLLARRQHRQADADKLWGQMQRIYRYFCFRESTVWKKPLLALEKMAFSLLARLRGGARPAAVPGQAAAPKADPLVQRVMADARALYPQRPMALDEHWQSDYTPGEAALYAPLFAEYDLVVAYATDGIWCYLCDIRHYVCFEHGTIRDFITDDSDTTHLALLAYGRSRSFMVTNTDCYDSAQYITQATGAPHVLGLHGIAVEQIARRMEQTPIPADTRARFGVPLGIPVFFSPARHSYEKAKGRFIKGNDLVVLAAAQLAEQGVDFRLVLADWGADVAMIRDMVSARPALAEKVIWTPPLGKEAFSLACLCVEAVLDQFALPVFGGIAFEVLASGRAALVSKRVDNQRMTAFYGSPMPYYPCDSAEDITRAMANIARDLPAARALAQAGKQWVLGCHSNQMILQKNLELFTYAQLI